MKERFNAKDARSMMLRFHTQTNGSTLTAQQPENNVIRVTLQALAAVLGGTQSLHTNSFDEALGLPTEETVRVALRTQQIIAHESGVTHTVDPLAGSYYVEYLTDQIEEKVWAYFDKIEKLGGMVNAIEGGYIQKEIQDAAYKYQREIEEGKRIVVGVNKYQMEENGSRELLRADPRIRETQARRIAEVRANRSQNKIDAVLRALANAAKDPTSNLMPLILDAARSYATIGEMCNVLRAEFGEYREVVVL